MVASRDEADPEHPYAVGVRYAEAIRGGPIPPADPLRGTWTEVALGPGYGACFVASRQDDGSWHFATSYDRETVVECAVVLMARMPSLAAANA